MFKRIHSNEGGFTLVELLVTISILAILFGIVALSLRGVGSGAEATVKDAELGVVQSAVDIWMAVNPTATLTPQETCGKVTSGAQFKEYLRHLPSEYCYEWTDEGVVSPCDCP